MLLHKIRLIVKPRSTLILLAGLFWYNLTFLTTPIYAQPTDCWGNPGYAVDGVPTVKGLECVFANIAKILIPVAGIAVFIMFIIGSFQLLTAGGEPKNAAKARQTVTFAVLGLILLLGVWFILKLISTITKVDVTQFKLPN